MVSRLGLYLITATVVLGSLGCSEASSVAPVTGTVTLDGKPLAGAKVEFQPKGASPESASDAITDDVGWYNLEYNPDVRGAVIGDHTVKISRPADSKAAPIPDRYNASSELTATVKSGSNDISFDLKSKP